MRGPAAWWRRLRAAGPGFPGYEVALALTLSAVTAFMSLAGGLAPVAAAGLAAADVALVAVRRRFPAAVLIGAAALTAVPHRADVVLAFGLAYAAGLRVRRPSRLAAALAGVLVLQVAGALLRDRANAAVMVLFSVGIFLVVSVFPATLAQLSAQRRRILTLMHERTVFMKEQQRSIAERARAREANRIAREMHDSLGHRLTLLSLYAGALRSAPGGHGDTARLLHATSVSAMDELRHILTVLRDQSHGGDPEGEHDVDKLVADARAAGARIELIRSGTAVEVPAMIEQAAFRTLQEGITNALRHARGGAIRAALRFEDGALVAEVVNEPGRGHDGATGGQGLYGLAERVRLAGGVLYHGPEPADRGPDPESLAPQAEHPQPAGAGGGFRVAATLPLTSVGPRDRDPAERPPEMPGDEFGADLRRVDQRRRVWTVVAGLAALLVIGLCAGGVWIAVRREYVSAATYDGLHVGDAAEGVREELPDRSARLGPGEVLPPAPPGGDCVAYRAAPSIEPARAEGYRFCFRNGTLIAKEELTDVG